MQQNEYPLLKDGVVACAWNKDRRYICIAPNNSSEILIYDTNKSQDISKWRLAYVLDEHSQQVSGLDWNEVTNKIISCGHDKNVIVYSAEVPNAWSPALVIVTNLDRAALCACWNRNGSMFGVGSGNKRIFLGYYEPDNNWWTSVSFKVHKSSVVALSFHPTEHLIASASTDKTIVISSSYVPEAGLDADSSIPRYGTILYTLNCGGWVNDIAWSISGKVLAGVSQDSQVHIINVKDLSKVTEKAIQWKGKAFFKTAFTSDDDLYCCGYDRIPVLYKGSGGEYAEKAVLDDVSAKAKTMGYLEQRISIFEQKKLGQASDQIEFLQVPKTKHKNTIVSVKGYAKGMLFTCDLSGYICFWKQ